MEEKFVAIMKGMAGKYPDAFDRQIDGERVESFYSLEEGVREQWLIISSIWSVSC